MPAPALHEDLAPLAFLLGTWAGEGWGEYPTVPRFAYREEVVFGHLGKPQLSYRQQTWHAEDGRPLHAEAGWFRPGRDGAVELVLAHPTGLVEVADGRVVGGRVALASTVVHGTATAKEVRAVTRVIEVDGDVLRYELAMAAVGVPLVPHLRAELRRAG